MATEKEQIIIDLQIDSKDVKDSEKDIENLTTQILALEKQVKSNRQEMKKSDAELQKENKSRKDLAVLVAKQQQSLSNLRRERTQNIKVIQSEFTSIQSLQAATSKMVAARNKVNLATKEGRTEFARLTTEISKNTTALKKYDMQIDRHTRNVGNYPKLTQNIKVGFGALTAGIGVAVGAIAAFGSATKYMFELNSGVKKVEHTFNTTNDEAKELTSTMYALSDTFGTDFNEVLNSSNTVSKEFGISAAESLKLIEEGFLKGSNQTGQFLDILKEYPTQLKSIGLSAEESFAIINQQVTSGVYSDKGIDALKEGGIRLRENTKAVQDALGPLDEQIRLQIKQEAAAGNTFKAMQLISKELNTANLTAEESQVIMSDVFGGAGEDALSFVYNLQDVSLSLEGISNSTTMVQDSTYNMDNAWNNFLLSVDNGEGIISSTFAAVQNGIAGILQGFTDLNNGTASFSDTIARTGILGDAAKIAANARIDAAKAEKIEKNKINNEEVENTIKKTDSQIEAEKLLSKIQKNINNKKIADYNKYLENVMAGSLKLKELEIQNMEDGYEKELAILNLKQEKESESLKKSLQSKEQLDAALLLTDSKYLKEKAKLYDEYFLIEEERNKNIALENEASKTLEIETLKVVEQLKLDTKEQYRNKEKEWDRIFEDEKFQKSVELANAGVELFQTLQDRKMHSLDTQMNHELRQAGDNEEKKKEIQQKYAVEKYRIVRKQFIADKAISVANAGIDVAAAIAKNLTNIALLPFITALGAVQIATILATPPPPAPTFAKGGVIVGGGTHASGNDTQIFDQNGNFYGRVEKGEMMTVLNRRGTEALMLSELNQKYGGRSFFSTPQKINAEGGSLNVQDTNTGNDLSQIVNAIQGLNISVNVNDINEAQSKKVRVVDNASF